MKKAIVRLLSALVLSFVTTASAIAINYSVGSWGPQTFPIPGNPYPGDAVEFQAYTGSLTLLPEVAAVGKINTLLWTVDYSAPGPGGDNGDFTFSASRTMSIDSGNGTVIQNGLLIVRSDADTLSLDPGATVSFNFGTYVIDVTPLGQGPYVRGNLGTTSYDVNAEFVLHQVPDGGLTAMLLGMGMLGLGWVRRMIK